MAQLNIKIGPDPRLDMAKFANMAKVREEAIQSTPVKEISGVFPINENAKALHPDFLELRIDSIKGQCLATLSIPATGGWENWQTLSAQVNGTVSGTHDLFLVFTGRKGPKLFNLDWWEML